MPLVILVCGTACSGKSTLATQLAQRLNLPNVLQVVAFLVQLNNWSIQMDMGDFNFCVFLNADRDGI